MEQREKIALFMPSFAGGGVEKVFLWLARGFLDSGHVCDLVVADAKGPYKDEVDPRVNVIDLHSSRVLSALPGLIAYLKENRPAILLSGQTHANILCLFANFLAGAKSQVVVSEPNTLSMIIKNSPGIKDKIMPWLARIFYPHAAGVTAVSRGVAHDLGAVTGIPVEDIKIIYNPLLVDDIHSKAGQPPDHPWYADGQQPVILAVGRLEPQKDFRMLIDAFTIVRKQKNVRLVILGEGAERQNLLNHAQANCVEQSITLPGFVTNPYSFMRKSAVVALSSRFEGFAMVVAEALACGAKIVATDCPSGPAEILENGKYGTLVPVGDEKMMADGLLKALDSPPLQMNYSARAADFALEKIVAQYLDYFSEILEPKDRR